VKVRIRSAFAMAAASGMAPAAASAAPPDNPAACATVATAPAISLVVTGIQGGSGRLRIYLYGDEPSDFMKKGKRLKRVNVTVRGRRIVEVCIRVTRPGRYALAVQHDVNGNRRVDWSDGGGAFRNPQVTVLRLRPRFDQVAFDVPGGVTQMRIAIKYLKDLRTAASQGEGPPISGRAGSKAG
jgi:uncharacterized protein (DUF2141 family)